MSTFRNFVLSAMNLTVAIGINLVPDAGTASAWAQSVIKIGEINSYKAQPAFLEPYRKGMEMAV